MLAGKSVAKQHQMVLCKITLGEEEKEECKDRAENQMVETKERGMV